MIAMRDGSNESVSTPGYVGRFAPSPTGPLHMGSLLAAVIGWLDARAHGGRWLLRVEDVDRPREVAGTREEILLALEAHGLYWDGPVVRQSERTVAYGEALSALERAGALFRCTCTRRQVRASGGVYPGTCRDLGRALAGDGTLRVRVGTASISFVDRLVGPVRQDLDREVGDFVVRRRDGLIAYQLAVVVDDAASGVTDVVRGMDLLASTPRQIHLQRSLGLPTPRYLHHPVLSAPEGPKLSKQTGAAAVDRERPGDNLGRVLTALGHAPPDALRGAPPQTLLAWAQEQVCVDALSTRPRSTEALKPRASRSA